MYGKDTNCFNTKQMLVYFSNQNNFPVGMWNVNSSSRAVR